MITWSYYGETGKTYLFGNKLSAVYRWAFVAFIFIGSITDLKNVLNFSDLMLGLMVIPNTIAILFLANKVKELSDGYFNQLSNGQFKIYHKETMNQHV